MRPLLALLTLFFIMIGSSVTAQETPSQKGYHLFNPTPRENMRDFSIDRPDVTESPITVDAGHFQVEADIVKYTLDDRGDGFRTLTFLNGLYKMGLSSSWDIHVGVDFYNTYQTPDGKSIDGSEEYATTTTIRLKHNFWGNDGGSKTALGMIPYIALSRFGDATFGLGIPFSYGISEKLDFGAQAQFDFIPGSDDGEDTYNMSYFQTIVMGGPLVGDFDFYVEGMATFFEGEEYISANGGLIYNVSPNVKIDLATNTGLTEGTPTRVYLGFSFRI
ncbi:transporter [Pseudochryseolinea flava]|nr:transporter [Pseudochryseolinea flava]